MHTKALRTRNTAPLKFFTCIIKSILQKRSTVSSILKMFQQPIVELILKYFKLSFQQLRILLCWVGNLFIFSYFWNCLFKSGVLFGLPFISLNAFSYFIMNSCTACWLNVQFRLKLFPKSLLNRLVVHTPKETVDTRAIIS